MANSKVFRKVSLERLSSPEQLDQLMRITNPRGWAALGGFWLLIIVALGWGILGSVPTNAYGEGILIRRGGVSDVVTAGSGQVEEILVEVGDTIEQGQIVARIRQQGIERQVQDNEARLTALRDDFEQLQSYAREQKRLSTANETRRRADLERSIATVGRQLELLEENLASQRELLGDGLITQQTILSSEQQVNQTRDQLAAQRLELAGLELERLETEQQLEQQLESRRTQLRDLELELQETRAALRENVEVVAAESGRVLELMAGLGDVVSPGFAILSMEVDSDELLAVLFVPAELGKQITLEMEARITPSTVKREEHGFILGEVIWVAEFPSTSRGMRRLLANDELISRLTAEGPPIQVDVRLHQDPSTPTGFRWSSSTGPQLEITTGTLTNGSVIVKRDRPISLVIPKLREWLGQGGPQ